MPKHAFLITISVIFLMGWTACDQQEQETPLPGGGETENPNYYNTGDVITYCTSTKSNPNTIVILGDGFITEDLRKTTGAFEKAGRKALDAFFSVEPFRSYKEYFNAYLIPARSAERGADILEDGESGLRDTYFDCSWDTDQRRPTYASNTVWSFVTTYCPDINKLTSLNARNNATNNCSVLLLVNDSRYAGISYITTSSKRAVAITPLAKNAYGGDQLIFKSNPLPPDNRVETVLGNWTNIAIHELGGHVFGRLADEYFYPEDEVHGTESDVNELLRRHQASAPYALNIAAVSRGEEAAPWYASWIVGEGANDATGFYEGAWLFTTGFWRPEISSCMDDDRLYFNGPSRELIVRRILGQAGEAFSFSAFLAKDSDYNASSSQIYVSDTKTDALNDIPAVPKRPHPILED